MRIIQIEQQQPHIVLYEFYKRVYPCRKKETLDIQVKINEPILAQREHLLETKLRGIYNKSLASSKKESTYWDDSLEDIEKLYDGKLFFTVINRRLHMFCQLAYVKSSNFAQLYFHIIREFYTYFKQMENKNIHKGEIHIVIGIFHHMRQLCIDGKQRNMFLYAMEDIDRNLEKKKNRISSKLERRQIVLRWIALEKKKNPRQKFKRWYWYVRQIGDHERFSVLELGE